MLCGVFLLQGCTPHKAVPNGARENVFSNMDIHVDGPASREKILLQPSQHNLNWQQPGGIITHNIHASLPQKDLVKIWQTGIGSVDGDMKKVLTTPVVDNGIVYILTTDGYVDGFDAKNAKRLFHVKIASSKKSFSGLGGGVSCAIGKLFVTTPYAELVAIDQKSQQILWRTELPSPARSAPSVFQDQLFVLTNDNSLLCVDMNSGAVVWEHKGMIENAGLIFGTNVAVAQNIVIVPYSSGEVYGLNRFTGESLWEENLSSFGKADGINNLPHICARPVVHNNLVYLISHSGKIAAINWQTGQIQWENEIGGMQSASVSGNALFMLTLDQVLVAMDCMTGKVRWIKQMDRFAKPDSVDEPIYWHGPVLVENKLLFTNTNKQMVFCDPENGNVVKNIELPAAALLDPVIADSIVYVITTNNTLVAYR